MAVPLPEATLPGILSYAEENNIDPQRTAKAVRAWQGQMRGYAQGTIAAGDPENAITPDNDRAWKGLLEVDRQATETLEVLRQKAVGRAARQLVPDETQLAPLVEAAVTTTADPAQRMDILRTGIMARKTAELFPDEAERESFTRKLTEAKGDPEAMDAPERWIEHARQIDAAAQQLDAAANDTAFTPTRYQSGQIGIGPNVLGSYLVREKEDGTGYQAYVQPVGDGAQPITVDLPTLADMRGKAARRLAVSEIALYNHYRAPRSDIGFMGELTAGDYQKSIDAAKSRAELLNGPDLAAALHVGLDDNLTQNPAFLDQLPGGAAAWGEQLFTRPLNQMARGFAQAAAALPGTDNRALTREGQEAVDVTTPGALANRYENSPEGTAPVADLIASGIESAGTMILPGALAKLGGRALAATGGTARGMMAAQVMDGAQVPVNAGWTAAFTTASGQSYAQTEQEAAALEPTDPAKAARLRRWNGLTSLARGAIEMGTEKIFPGEMALLQGGRIPLRSLATMPFQEAAEEAAGALGQNAISLTTGQSMEDPLEAARGGFYGAAPFVASAALAGRFSPDPAAETPPSETPDATLFPPANANPPDLSTSEAQPPSLLAGIAQRGGRENPTIQPDSIVAIPTSGRTTAYGYANDETPDRNSSDGIGAFVSTAEAARIRRGEPSELRLRPGDLAVSRDIEAQFRARGIRPGDPVTLQYADGTTHTGRWMDRTDGSLDGRFDLYSPSGPPPNDGSKITGFLPGGDPSGQDPSTINPQPSTPSTPEELEDGTPNLLPDGVTPQEVLTFQQAQDDHRARNPDTATQPEPLRTLAAQLDLVREGSKPSMIFEGVTRDQIPAALRPLSMRDSPIDGVQTPGGYVVFNKTAIRPLVGLREADPYTSVQAAARAAFRDPAKSGLILGYGTPDKSATANSALVTRDPDGTEVLAVATDDTDVSTTAAIEAAINRANAPRRALSASAANFRRSPLAEFVIQSGGIMSRSTARQSGMFRNSPALWSDAPDRLADPTHNVIYGNTRPDELAEAAVRAGLLPEGSTQRELWEALGNESTAPRSQARAERQVESDLRNQERAARREPLDVTLARRAASRRQESQQAQRQTAEPVSIADPLPDPTDDPDYVPFARPNRSGTGEAMNDAPFGEDNRLTNINPDGAMMRRIREENPAFDPSKETQTIYRSSVGTDLRVNDYVALNKKIAQEHLKNLKQRGEKGILSQFQVRTEDLLMANDATEFVYHPLESKPLRRAAARPPRQTVTARGVTPRAAQEALTLLRQTLPAVADATRLIPNRAALAAEINDYRPQDWADMGPGGVQGFYDPRTGQTTVILDNIEVRPGETPMRAVARIILHERIAHAGLAVLREADPTFARQWQQLTAQIPQGELQAIAAQYPELSGNPAALAEEWLAQQVEARAGKLLPPNSLAAKLWNALKAALARLFARYSRPTPLDAEVDRIILLARNALKTQFVPAQAPLRFSKADTAIIDSPGYQPPVEPEGDPLSAIGTGTFDEYEREQDEYEAAFKKWLDAIPTNKAIQFQQVTPYATYYAALTKDPKGGWRITNYSGALEMPTGHSEFETRLEAAESVKSYRRIPKFPFKIKAGEFHSQRTPFLILTEPGKEPRRVRFGGYMIGGERASVRDESQPDADWIEVSADDLKLEPLSFARPGQRSDIRYAGTGPYRVQSQGWRATLTGNALPREFADLLAQGKNETAALNQAAAQIGQDLNAAIDAHGKAHGLNPADVLDLVDDAMANPSTLAALQDPRLKEATRKARNFLDDMSEAIATITGGQLGSAIMANRGSWMRRSYAAFDPAAGWHYDALEKAAQAGKSIAGQPAAKLLKDARDFLLAEDPSRTPAQIEGILRGLMDRGNWERALTGQSVSKPTESLMRRKELPEALRAVMGEERNPLKRYTLSAGFQAAFIARHEQQERMAQIGLQMGIFSPAREGVYTEAISDGAPTAAGQRRSGLAGLYTTPELKAALARSQGTTPDSVVYKAGDLIKFLSGEAKLNKVALSLDSYAVNLIGNVIGLVQTGDLLTLSAFRRMAEAFKVQNSGRTIAALGTAQALLQETRRAHLARLTAAGVADSSFSTADLLASLDNNVLAFIEADNRWNRASGGIRGAVLGQGLGRIFGTTGQAIGAVTGGAIGTAIGGKRIVDAQKQIAQWTLGAPDRFGKILAFQNNYEAHRAAGMTDRAAFELATEKTLNTMPDYSKMPELAKQLSQLGIMGSFIGFQIEVYRNAFHNFRYAYKELRSGNPTLMALGARRLIGASTVQALALGGLQAILTGLFASGASDDEDKAYRRALARPYEKYGRLAYTALDGEKASFFNTSYLLPQVTMWEIGKAAMEGKDFEQALGNAWEASRNQFAGGGVHTDPMLEALMNSRKDGRPVSTEAGYRQAAERIAYYLRRALEPGTIDKLDRVVRATQGRDRNTRAFDLKEEGLRTIGVRQSTYKHTDTIKSRLYQLNTAYDNATATARTAWKDNAPGARPAALTRANERIAEIRAEYQAFQQDLATLKLLPLLQTVNDNRDAAGTRRPILPKEFKPLVETPQGPKPLPTK